MSTDIIIKQKGLFKKNLNVKDFILPNMRYGIFKLPITIENEIGNYTILFYEDQLYRGFQLNIDNNNINLTLKNPTCEKEIILFYKYIKDVCNI